VKKYSVIVVALALICASIWLVLLARNARDSEGLAKGEPETSKTHFGPIKAKKYGDIEYENDQNDTAPDFTKNAEDTEDLSKKTPESPAIHLGASIVKAYSDTRKALIDDMLELFQSDSLKKTSGIIEDEDLVSAYSGALANGDEAVAIEVKGKVSYYGIIYVMVVFNAKSKNIVDVRSTQHDESAGVRPSATIETFLFRQFKDQSISHFTLKYDDGQIDAVSGATVVSNGFCSLVNKAVDIYKRIGGDS
jgi:Na+-translocating ferredoxin:NAD+ oxidoreductase RnfG subunit